MSPDELLERAHWEMPWAPPDAVVVDRPELFYVSCPRDIHYLNSVTRTRAPACRLPALVEEVARAHAGVRSRWMVCPQNRGPALERALRRAGYAPGEVHDGRTIAVSDFRSRPAPGIELREVDGIERLRDWMEVFRRGFGIQRVPAPGRLPEELAHCTGPGARIRRFVAYDELTGLPLSCGGLTVFPQLDLGFLWAGCTVPEGRRRGAWSAVLAARIRRLRELGISRAGLYALTGSSSPLLARMGFARHGRMTWWDRPP